MDEYFERIWQAVPAGAAPERFESRVSFLLAHVEPGDRVLDLGCGTGEFSSALLDAGARPLAVDVAPEALRRASMRDPRLEVATPDSLGNAEFDVVWAGELLEHVQDGLGLLGRVRQALRPGGRLLVTTPDHPRRALVAAAVSRRAFARAFHPRSDHVRFFNRLSLGDLLEAAAFEGVEIQAEGGVLFASARRP